jgi:hypothetical protein
VLEGPDLADCVAAALQLPFSSDDHAQAMLSLLAGAVINRSIRNPEPLIFDPLSGLALSDESRQQFMKPSVIEQLVCVTTSSAHDAVLVEACTCMANLAFRLQP